MNGIFGMHGVKLFTGAAVSVLVLALAGPTPALADTIEAALVRAYQNNPQLNAQRAQVRSTDENVPQALSGYRPKVALTASTGYQYQDIQQVQRGPGIHEPNPLQPNAASLTINQTLYNGNQTANKTRAAESQVSGSREGLRVLEQTVSAAGRQHLHGLPA
ncbi:outer membrane protein TolC [Bradyrhizobium diazoefficiens]